MISELGESKLLLVSPPEEGRTSWMSLPDLPVSVVGVRGAEVVVEDVVVGGALIVVVVEHSVA